MRFSVVTRRLSLLRVAATVGVSAAMIAGNAHATLTWYDGFAIGADDGAGPNYVAGTLADQLGGSDAGAGVGFFDNGAGDPNPWLGVNNTDPEPDDGALKVGSLTRQAQSKPSTGDSIDTGPAIFGGCCYTSRVSRDFNTPLQGLTGQVYMGFLVNFGTGNPNDPHYRSIEFWNGKNVDDPETPDDDAAVGRVGDSVLTMSLGFSSFGNYNGAINQGVDPDPNTQLSLKTKGVREIFGSVVDENVQLDEHLEWADQIGKTHSIVIGFDLTTDDVESGGVGDTISVWLNPTPDDVTPPTPSAVVSGIDINMDSMSSLIRFTFTGATLKADTAAFDELRVATSLGAGGAGDANTLWSEVAILGVPEPASLSLVALGVLGMLATARRKRS
jgi:hypothetical protein